MGMPDLQILHEAFSAAYAKGLAAQTEDWRLIATGVSSQTRTNTYAWLGAFPRVREWVGPRVVEALSGEAYQLTNKDWELTIGVMKNDIDDDQYGLYAPVFESMGAESQNHKAELVFSALNQGHLAGSLGYDGKPFFATDHPVGNGVYSNSIAGDQPAWYIIDDTRPLKPIVFQMRKEPELVRKTEPTEDGVFFNKELLWGVDARYVAGYAFWQTAVRSQAALSKANLAAARLQLRRIKDAKGRSLAIRPSLLIVGPELEDAALELLTAQQINGTTNVVANTMRLHVSPYID